MTDFSITLATAADLAAINDIYNYYVLNSTCTYQTLPETPVARRAWFDCHGPVHPVTVLRTAHNGENIIAGWGSLSPFHPRAAFGRTVENSVYIHHDHHRKGFGKAILADLLLRAKTLGHHTIIAAIDSMQTSSIALHNGFGFKTTGELKEAGYKFNSWLNLVYMQYMV